ATFRAGSFGWTGTMSLKRANPSEGNARAFLGRFVIIHCLDLTNRKERGDPRPSRPERTLASARLQLKEWRAANTSCVPVPHFNERGIHVGRINTTNSERI